MATSWAMDVAGIGRTALCSGLFPAVDAAGDEDVPVTAAAAIAVVSAAVYRRALVRMLM